VAFNGRADSFEINARDARVLSDPWICEVLEPSDLVTRTKRTKSEVAEGQSRRGSSFLN